MKRPAATTDARRPWPMKQGLFSSKKLLPRAAILFLLLSTTCSVPGSNAQTLSESQLKAAFLFNFTRFVEWPDNSFATPSSPFAVCIMGATSLVAPLTETAAGKLVNGHSLTIRTMKSADDPRICQILFLSATEERRTPHILDSVKGSSVLTVSEVTGFALAGGMINFVVQENRVRLEMNVDAATHNGLKVSAKLIAVSHLVSRSPAEGSH